MIPRFDWAALQFSKNIDIQATFPFWTVFCFPIRNVFFELSALSSRSVEGVLRVNFVIQTNACLRIIIILLFFFSMFQQRHLKTHLFCDTYFYVTHSRDIRNTCIEHRDVILTIKMFINYVRNHVNVNYVACGIADKQRYAITFKNKKKRIIIHNLLVYYNNIFFLFVGIHWSMVIL